MASVKVKIKSPKIDSIQIEKLYENILYDEFSCFKKESAYETDKFLSWEDVRKYNDHDHTLKHIRKSEVIFRNGDKLVLSLYEFEKTKGFDTNKIQVSRLNSSITINLSSGCFYATEIKLTHNTQTRKNIIKNGFRLIEYFAHRYKESTLAIFKKILSADFSKINTPDIKFNDFILEWFLEHHKVKKTDNYKINFLRFYPGLTFIKKCKYNLTEAICKKYKLKGKKVKKIINLNDAVSIFNLKLINSILDVNVFNELTDEAILNFFVNTPLRDKNSFSDIGRYHIKNEVLFDTFEKNKLNKNLLSLEEQRKFLRLIEQRGISSDEIIDHITIRNQIFTKFNLRLKMNFNSINTFNNEHNNFSSLLFERKDYKTILEYNENIINLIEQNIFLNQENENIYNVKLLKSTEEYVEEGKYQHHCVASYVDSSSNIISVSLNGERMTCEFNKDGKLVQSKMKLNNLPTDEWLRVLDQLVDRVKNIYNVGLTIEKIKRKELIKSFTVLDINEELVDNKGYTPIIFAPPPKRIKVQIGFDEPIELDV